MMTEMVIGGTIGDAMDQTSDQTDQMDRTGVEVVQELILDQDRNR